MPAQDMLLQSPGCKETSYIIAGCSKHPSSQKDFKLVETGYNSPLKQACRFFI